MHIKTAYFKSVGSPGFQRPPLQPPAALLAAALLAAALLGAGMQACGCRCMTLYMYMYEYMKRTNCPYMTFLFMQDYDLQLCLSFTRF